MTSDRQPHVDVSRATNSTLQRLIGELWRYRWLVPAVALVVTAAVAFWVVRQPKIYEAVATLEYDPRPTQPLGKALEDTSSGQVNYWDTQEFYETQNFILRSRSLAERLVRKLSLHMDPDFLNVPKEARPSFKGVSVEQAAATLQGRIVVAPVRDTRLVLLKVRDGDPDRAQLLANTLSETYVEKSLEDRLGSSSRALEWLGAQMQNLKRELEGSERALYKFREENDSLSASLGERQKIIAGQLQSYSDAFTQVHTRRIQTEAKLGVLRELMQASPDPIALQAGAIGEDSAIEALREKYRDASVELAKLTVTYGGSHPQVQTARATVDSVLTQLTAQLEGLIRGVEADVSELERAEQGLQAALSEVNRQGLALSLQEMEYTRLDRERLSKIELYDLVMERAAQTDLTRALRVANARVVDRAVRPGGAVSPRVQTTVSLGLLFGVGLGFAVALFAAQLDNKLRSASDVEALGVTILGVLPAVAGGGAAGPGGSRGRTRVETGNRDLIVHHEPRSTVAECCRTIRTNLTFQSADKPLRTLSITSAMPREGKTTVSVSIAIALAQSGRRVLIVDTDLRKPRLHHAFSLAHGAGLTSVLAGEATVEQVLQTTDVPNLTLMQCGPIPPNPSELLHTRRFSEIVDEVKSKFDTVIFDSPPLGAVTDPAIIATHVDGTILVVRSRSTTRASFEAAVRQLRGVSARMVGAVLNDVDLSAGAYGPYYGYYRGYYGDESTKGESPRREAPTSV